MSNSSSFSPLMPGEAEEGGKGALFTVIVIIVLLLVGGIYLLNEKPASENAVPIESSSPVETEEAALATSTNLIDIDKDLDNLGASIVDSELDHLEKELQEL